MVLSHERSLRIGKIRQQLEVLQAEACLISTPVNTYYLHQRIFKGYTFIPREGDIICFVRRPVDLAAEDLMLEEGQLVFIRKPEQMAEHLRETMPGTLAVEGEEMPRSEWLRLEQCFSSARLLNASQPLRVARSVKTEFEIGLIRESARLHEAVYRKIPSVWHPGMSEVELEIEIEYLMRKGGCLGLFRTYGNDMEAFMGSVLGGDNASVCSPYDFALGGAGHPSNPIGASQKTPLKAGQSILIDMCGNFTGYLDDMSRCFAVGKLSEKACRAHMVALEIQNYVQENLKEGAICQDIYEGALGLARKNRLEDRFMGSRQQARFVGHGTGLVINELPVLAPRMTTPLEKGMVLAVEPKIIVDGTGAVGTENTFVVGAHGGEKLSNLSDNIVSLCI